MTTQPALPSANSYKAENPEGYEGVMGRWSRLLAPQLVRLGGLADGERILDVGCGTGSLTFEVSRHANVALIGTLAIFRYKTVRR